MKKSKFSEAQIVKILGEVAAGKAGLPKWGQTRANLKSFPRFERGSCLTSKCSFQTKVIPLDVRGSSGAG